VRSGKIVVPVLRLLKADPDTSQSFVRVTAFGQQVRVRLPGFVQFRVRDTRLTLQIRHVPGNFVDVIAQGLELVTDKPTDVLILCNFGKGLDLFCDELVEVLVSLYFRL
jgi:hypothetical protein